MSTNSPVFRVADLRAALADLPDDAIVFTN